MLRALKKRELFISAIAVAGILEMATASAYAQTNPIDFCRNSSASDKARIECLEEAIRGLMPIAAAENTESVPPASPTTGIQAPVVASSEDSPAAVAPAKGIGAEQVIARQERASKDRGKLRKERLDKEAITARLVDFARTSTGRLVLVLDNGQVWAQRAGDNQEVRLRDGDTPTVRIRRGMISGYRIEFSSPNTTIVAERLK